MAESFQPQDFTSSNSTPGVASQLNGKKRDVLLLCSDRSQRFSDIVHAVNISESGLAKSLDGLIRTGLVTRIEGGRYTATIDGLERARQLRREDDVRRQKLARKLRVLQNLVSPKELLGFENVRALLSEKRRGLHAYEALALASALELSYLLPKQELDSQAEVALYEQALKLLRLILRRKTASPTGTTESQNVENANITLTVRFSLEEGRLAVMRALMDDIDTAASPAEKQRLQAIMTQVQQPQAMQDALKRFL